MKNKNLLLSPDPFFIVLLLLLGCTYLNAVAIKDTFVSPANTISGELRLDNNSEINGTDSNGYVYTTNLSVNDGQCYDTDGNAVTCQAKGENVKALYFKVYNGDGSDGDKEISSDLTIDSSNIDSYDNVGKFEVDDGVALTLDDVTIHANGDFIFDDDAKDLTIKGNVVIYADKFELGNNVGINIAADASLRIITSDDVTIGDSSFIDTNGHPEHFALFTKATISFDDYTGSKAFDGFFYSDSDFTIGKDVNITGAVTGSDVTEVKDGADINFDSSVIENTDISELTEDYCSRLFGGPASTIDGGELDIETNVKLENTPSDGSLYTDNINTNDGKCYDTDGNEVTCKANNITAFAQIFTVYNGDGSDGDKEISSDLTIDSSNIDSYDNVGKFEVDDGVALTLDDVTIHANGDFIFDDDAKDLTIKGNVVIYADKFELGNNVGINIAADASLRIITSDDVTIGDSSFIDTNGHPEHFALFTKATISFDDYTGSKAFDGFFYSDSDFTIGKDVNITGAVTGQKVQIKDGSVIAYDSSAASLVTDTGVCINTPVKEKNYKFDAWDTFRDINDRNISTKIVNNEFNLTVASLKDDGSNYQEFNGTVCVSVDDNISKLDFRDDNISIAYFKVSRAIKETKVYITWKKDEDDSCPLSSEDNETNSTDNFAIRPKSFKIIPPTQKLYAGEDFNITFEALNGSDLNSTDYNESNVSSFDVNITEINNNCKTGNLDINETNVIFSNGAKILEGNYSEVGEINITIEEKQDCNKRFASVDCKDDNVSEWSVDKNLSIKSNTTIIKIKPYNINITYGISDINWTYMDGNLSQPKTYIELNVTLDAYAKGSSIALQDFNKTCYAKDINISFWNTDINNTDDFNGTYHDVKKDEILTDINFTNLTKDHNWTIRKDDFMSGEGNLSIRFDINRSYNKPISPVDVNFSDINIITPNIAKNENNASMNDKNITFYYGRIKTKDIATNKQNTNNSIEVEIYNTNNTDSSLFQDSLNWYKMRYDSETNITELIPQEGFVYNVDVNKSGITLDKNSSLTVQNGRTDTNISNSWGKSDSAYIHIKIPPYLWYSNYNDYNDSNKSDCSQHPCFKYSYITKSQGKSITSGNYNGTTIMTKDFDANRTRKGVKVFR